MSKQATDNSVSKIDGSFTHNTKPLTHATTCPAVLITLGIIETSKISDFGLILILIDIKEGEKELIEIERKIDSSYRDIGFRKRYRFDPFTQLD